MSGTRFRVPLQGDTLSLGGTEGRFTEVASGLDRTRGDLHVSCVRAEGPLRARLEAVGLHPWSLGPSSFKLPRLAVAILRLIHASNVLVRSTFADGDASKVREALAFGVAVIASDTDFRTGLTLFRKGDVADPVEKLVQVLGTSRAGCSAPLAFHDQPARDFWQLYSKLTSPGDTPARGVVLRSR